jgi:outer membrane receptor protein involved in Fe transport
MAGVPDFVVTETGSTSNGLRTTGLGAYVQDDIRVLPRFTLNVGLRWEFNSPPIEIHNRFSVPDLSAASATCSPQPDCQFIQAGTDGIPRATYGKNLHDFAPRIGIAWRPLKTERFVVRSAYGIFYDENILNLNILPRFNPPFVDISALLQNSTASLRIQDILNQAGLPEPQANFVSRNFRDAYMQDWNVDLQYEVQPNWMIDLAYVGTKGTHLPATRNMNEENPFTQVTPYPQFGSILLVEPRANSIYNALQFRSEKRVRQGLAFLAAYTWSRSIDDDSAVFSGSVSPGVPQNSYDFRLDRGLSDFQVEQRLVLSYLYDLPFGTGRRWLDNPGIFNRIFGSWQTAGIATMQTGSPFTVNTQPLQVATSITAFGYPYRPDLVGDPSKAGPVAANPGCSAPAQIDTPNMWFNPCAFASPQNPLLGTAGRNILTGPGLNNLDFSLLKNIPLRHEGRRLEFRFEFFNLFNIPHFDIPGRTFGTSAFGMVQSANEYGNKPPRQIQLGLKYVF